MRWPADLSGQPEDFGARCEVAFGPAETPVAAVADQRAARRVLREEMDRAAQDFGLPSTKLFHWRPLGMSRYASACLLSKIRNGLRSTAATRRDRVTTHARGQMRVSRCKNGGELPTDAGDELGITSPDERPSWSDRFLIQLAGAPSHLKHKDRQQETSWGHDRRATLQDCARKTVHQATANYRGSGCGRR